jgi:hypothetical protein
VTGIANSVGVGAVVYKRWVAEHRPEALHPGRARTRFRDPIRASSRNDGPDQLPRRELLQQLARSYHHLQNEHKRAPPGGRVRRRLEDRMLDVRERFERLLEEWVPETDLAERWRAHLHNRAPEPAGPPPIDALIFRGVNDAGSIAEIRRRGGELRVTVDRTLTERLSAADLPADWFRAFRVSETEFRETFSASEDALRELAGFLADGEGGPPWDAAEELLGDGLVDVHFAVTPRGRRALASGRVG